jgi:SAM-dependent methyltransferase
VTTRIIRGADDPAYVRRQYESESGLRARKSAYKSVAGIDARDVAFDAVRDTEPQRVLEVGCGEGEFSERLVRDLELQLVAIDQSPRMVELTAARGIDARLADVQKLPFEDREFDVAVAAWMLYHVPELDSALAELARVLRPGGRLVAVTNRENHLGEMFELVGIEGLELPFGAENGAELLAPHFGRVELRDATGTVTFEDAEPIRAYFRSSERLSAMELQVPDLDEPLVVHRRPVVFVADKTS